jgi:hypothetical protein
VLGGKEKKLIDITIYGICIVIALVLMSLGFVLTQYALIFFSSVFWFFVSYFTVQGVDIFVSYNITTVNSTVTQVLPVFASFDAGFKYSLFLLFGLFALAMFFIGVFGMSFQKFFKNKDRESRDMEEDE